jgi:hypothetical protein
MTPQSIKQKGRNAENLVVEFLRQWWPQVERRRLAGVHDRGDIAGVPGTVIEVKSGAKIDLAGWLKELDREVANDNARHGVLVVKPRGTTDATQFYAVVRFEEWVDLRRACNG